MPVAVEREDHGARKAGSGAGILMPQGGEAGDGRRKEDETEEVETANIRIRVYSMMKMVCLCNCACLKRIGRGQQSGSVR